MSDTSETFGTGASSRLEVPAAFQEWVAGLPASARSRLSIHDLRQIWEPLYIARVLHRDACLVCEELRDERDILKRTLDKRDQRIAELEIQRNEARQYAERLYAECAGTARDVACAWCGQIYEAGTPRSQNERLAKHAKVCTKHPLRAAEKRIAELEAQLDAERKEHRAAAQDYASANRLVGDYIARLDEARRLLRDLQEALGAFRSNVPALRRLKVTDWMEEWK